MNDARAGRVTKAANLDALSAILMRTPDYPATIRAGVSFANLINFTQKKWIFPEIRE